MLFSNKYNMPTPTDPQQEQDIDKLLGQVAMPAMNEADVPSLDEMIGDSRFKKKQVLKKPVESDIDLAERLKDCIVLDGEGAESLADSMRECVLQSGDKVYGATDKGIGYKDINQDRVGVNPDKNLVVVADGIGGGTNGEVAAQYLTESLLAHPGDDTTVNPHLEALDMARDRLVREKDRGRRNSSTCFASVQITNDKADTKYAKIIRVGDVKVLIIRDREIIFESIDESLTQQKLDRGEITEEEALFDSDRHIITNDLSAYSDNIDVEAPYSKPVKKGDIILIMTDGISDNLTPKEIIKWTRGTKTPEQIIQILSRLTDSQMKGGGNFKMPGKPDNRGVAVIHVS